MMEWVKEGPRRRAAGRRVGFTLLAAGILAACAAAVPTGVRLKAAGTILDQVAALPVPDRPHFASQVGDGIFAYLVGLLDRDEYGVVTGDHLAEVIKRSGKHSRVPEKRIIEFRRAPIPGGGSWVRAIFNEPLDVPVPYAILGYHPGSLVASKQATFEEEHLGRLSLPNPSASGPTTIEIDDVYLWSLVEGEVLIDIDSVVDAILGGRIDDTYIVALAIFRYQNDRFAMALGFNHDGEGRSGALDLEVDKIRFPSPDEFKVVGRSLRSRSLERLAELGIPAWVPPHRRRPS